MTSAPQCMGQCRRAPLQAERIASSRKHCQRRTQTSSGREAGGAQPAIGHIGLTSCESSSPSGPLLHTGAGKPPSTDLQGVTASPAPSPKPENYHHLTSEWETLPEGRSFLRRRKTNHTFSILHYMWLCTICWYPDDGVHVWNIWYLAFSRWHEIKCIIHRVTSVFATIMANPPCCVILSPTIWFDFTKHEFNLSMKVLNHPGNRAVVVQGNWTSCLVLEDTRPSSFPRQGTLFRWQHMLHFGEFLRSLGRRKCQAGNTLGSCLLGLRERHWSHINVLDEYHLPIMLPKHLHPLHLHSCGCNDSYKPLQHPMSHRAKG